MTVETTTHTAAPQDAATIVAQVRVITTRSWHAPLGNALLIVTELICYLLTLVLIIAAIVLNETMIINMLDDMQDTTLRMSSGEMEIVIVIHTIVKIMLAVLAVSSLIIALLLRKWRRKNKLLETVYALTEVYVTP